MFLLKSNSFINFQILLAVLKLETKVFGLMIRFPDGNNAVLRSQKNDLVHRSRSDKLFTFQSDNENDQSYEQNLPTDGTDIDDKPRYRSNLQRLNQASQGGQPRSRLKKKMKSKRRTRNQAADIDRDPNKYPVNINPNSNTNTKWGEFILSSELSEEYSIDSFLSGEYDRPFSEDAAAPHPELSPGETIEYALHALRDLDVPEVSHGAAVFSRFLAPMGRLERWGGSVSGKMSPWKEILRGSLTPTMLARRIRASEEFSVLLDWDTADVTEGLAVPEPNQVVGSTVAFVNAALFFRKGVEPSMVQFTLWKVSGVWLIHEAAISKKEWFIAADGGDNANS